jgi:integrase
MARSRNPNFRSSIYKGADGYWHGRVTVGVRDDGKPDRRHVMSKNKSEVSERVRQLERDRDRGTVRKVRQRWRVSDWLKHWLDNIAVPPRVTVNTHDGYRIDVEKHLIPGVGAHWLDRLEPEHLERLYVKMQDTGLAAGTAHHVHRTARNALNEAVRRGHLARNPAVLAKAPAVSEEEVEPYEVPEVQRLLEAATRGRNSARWAVALALGLRQGEALGLKWDDIDLDKGTIRIRRSRIRPRYEHGCAGDCQRPAGRCPKRRNTRPITGDVKSKAGRRVIGLPAPLVALLRKHRAQQEAERARARQLWRDEGWVFATPTGGPLNHNTDYHEWKRLLKTAGLREARLHDARHTAATVLLILRQPERTVMSLMGWSSTDMAKRYQHVTDTVRADVASLVGSLIWEARTEGDADETVTVRRDSLATILPLVEEGLLEHDDDLDLTKLQAALADLQTAMATHHNDANGEAK